MLNVEVLASLDARFVRLEALAVRVTSTTRSACRRSGREEVEQSGGDKRTSVDCGC